jgi:hypothetical protein
MYFHGQIYPLKLKMVKNLTVVLRVGSPMGRVKIRACPGGYIRRLDQRVCREKFPVRTYSLNPSQFFILAHIRAILDLRKRLGPQILHSIQNRRVTRLGAATQN